MVSCYQSFSVSGLLCLHCTALHCIALHCSVLMWRTENYRFQLSFTSSYANEDHDVCMQTSVPIADLYGSSEKVIAL